MTIQTKILNTCAWCGVSAPVNMVLCKTGESRSTLILLIINIIRIYEYSIVLPICDDCKKKLADKRRWMYLISGLGGIASMMIMPVVLYKLNIGIDMICVMVSFLSGIIGGIIGALIGQMIIHLPQWGKITNGKLSFNNDQFREQVMALNPELYEQDLTKYADKR